MMFELDALQQSDAWLRARCGRITGSRMADVCGYLKVKSKNGAAGDSNGDRLKYRRELIWERCSGRLDDHWVSEYMERGEKEEGPARIFYEGLTRTMVEPVSFVVHADLPFFGASADGLIGRDGILEIKNPKGTNHLIYLEDGILPLDYVPQCASELACAGKQRRFADFLSFDRRLLKTAPSLCYFLKRTGRDELEYEIGYGETKRTLTGESVIDYFAEEAHKMEGEINAFIEKHGCNPIAPFPIEFKEEIAEPDPEGLITDSDIQAVDPTWKG